MPRSPEQVVWDFVQGWLNKATTDLRSAEMLLEGEFDDYWAAAFHAQQAAEKYLKALLVRHQIPFPKTHDIGVLLKLSTSGDDTLPVELAGAATLTAYGVEARYPGVEVSREQARAAVQEATRVRDAVQERLREYLAGGRPDSSA
jgi:HEPN domain-containing protein